MADPNIFPTIRVVTPRVLCECVGATVTRVVQLGRVTEPCLSTHIREPQVESPQLQLPLEPHRWDVV